VRTGVSLFECVYLSMVSTVFSVCISAWVYYETCEELEAMNQELFSENRCELI
jgi:hypothetical protein